MASHSFSDNDGTPLPVTSFTVWRLSTQPTVHTYGGVLEGGDKQQLPDKIRTTVIILIFLYDSSSSFGRSIEVGDVQDSCKCGKQANAKW
jgi:hypothetical protein